MLSLPVPAGAGPSRSRHFPRLVLALLALLAPLAVLTTGALPAPAWASETVSVEEGAVIGALRTQHVTVRGRPGATQGFYLIQVKNPLAQVVLFPGGKGNIGVSARGIKRGGNFLVRSRGHFAGHGFNVAVLDVPSDRKSLRGFRVKEKHVQDLLAVVAHLRGLSPAPVWLVGTSRGTLSAANGALPRRDMPAANGLVLTSSLIWNRENKYSLFDFKLAAIRLPTLVVHHRHDGCMATLFQEVPRLMEALSGAPITELAVFRGGNPGKPGLSCKGKSHHGFLGIEVAVVARIAEWIKAHPPH